MNKKYTFTGIALLVVVGLCTGWYLLYGGRDKPKYDGPIERVSIGTVSNETSTLVLIAESNGYFSDSGLDVAVREFQSGNFSVDALLDNKVDLASCSEFALVERIFKRGKNLRYMGSYATVENTEVVARKDMIKSPGDLKGKKIGVTNTSIASFYLGVFLTFNGLTLDDVEQVDIKPFDMKDAMAEGRVDAVITWEPNSWAVKEKMGDSVVVWPGQNQPYYWLLVSSDKVLREKEGAIGRFVAALARAEDFARQKRDQAKEIVRARYNFNPAYLNEVWWTKTRYELSLDQALLVAMEDEARWMIKNGMSHGHREIPDYLQYLHSDAMVKARPGSVSLIATEKRKDN